MAKVLVVGLDGASWNLIEPWISSDLLPNLKKLINHGTSGYLESTIPISTYPAWKCYSTGKNPGKLGAYFWFEFDLVKKKLKMTNSKSFKALEIWDYLGLKGFKSLIVNMPTTYPPKPIKGIMISGFNALDHQEYTYPSELKKELLEKFNYKLNPSGTLRIEPGAPEVSIERDNIIEEIFQIINTNFDVVNYLIKKNNFDFIHLTIFYIDHLQHYLWKYLNTNHKYSNVLLEAWKLIDRKLGNIITNLNDSGPSHIIIMSDHGFDRLKGIFQFNKWLQKQDFLKMKRYNIDITLFFDIFRLNQKKALKIYNNRLAKNLIKLVPSNILQKIWFSLKKSGKSASFPNFINKIDWNKTKTIMIGEGIVLISNIIKKDKDEYDKFRDMLINKIKLIKDPKNGHKIVKEVFKGEDIYLNAKNEKIPDILIIPENGYALHLDLSDKSYISDEELWIYDNKDGFCADHTLYGIFIANGPSIKSNHRTSNAKIYDLAPTILHIFGLPIPNDMDGRVLTEIFEPDSEPAKRKPVYVDPSYYERKIEKEKTLKKIKKIKKLKKI